MKFQIRIGKFTLLLVCTKHLWKNDLNLYVQIPFTIAIKIIKQRLVSMEFVPSKMLQLFFWGEVLLSNNEGAQITIVALINRPFVAGSLCCGIPSPRTMITSPE